MASNVVTEDQARFIYIGIAILEKLTGILHDLVSRKISPTNIQMEINKCPNFPKLNPFQRALVAKASVDGYREFDISLLYILLRNVCQNIAPPTKGWGNVRNLPTPGEVTVGDDIERIRIIRNTVYGHVSSASITEPTFKSYWAIIEDVCRRLDIELGSSYEEDLKSVLESVLDRALLRKYQNELETNRQKENLAIEAIGDVIGKLEELSGDVKRLLNKPTSDHQIEIIGDSEVKHGENAYLTAIVPSEWKQIQVNWQKIDVDGTHYIDIEDKKYGGSRCRSHNPLLVINNVNSNDTGHYQIEVSYTGGNQTSQTFYIFVIGEPPIVEIINPRHTGNAFIFPCNISGEPPAVVLKWTKDGKDLEVSSKDEKFSGGTATDPSLTIKEVNTDDVGEYQCSASNVCGVTRSISIVLDKPRIELRRVQQCGNNMKVVCSVSTKNYLPISKTEWKKDGLTLDLSNDQEKYLISNDDDFSLTIVNVDYSDEGQYQFSATNVLGSSDSKICIDVSSLIYYRRNVRYYFQYDVEDNYIWVDLEVLPTCQETANISKCSTIVSKEIKEEKPTKVVEEIQKILDVRQIICFGLLFQERYVIGNRDWLPLLERISLHLGKKSETERNYRQVMNSMTHEHVSRTNGILKFASEEAELETLWAFLSNRGTFKSNTEFLFENTTSNFSFTKHLRTQRYRKKELESCICMPDVFTELLVRKLGTDVLEHPTIEDSSIYQLVSAELKIPMEVLQWGKDGQERYFNYLKTDRIKVYSARGMILGCAGSGKTTLLHRLRNDGMDKINKIPSTRGMEIHSDVLVFDNEDKDLKVNKEKILNHLKVPLESIAGRKGTLQETETRGVLPIVHENDDSTPTLERMPSPKAKQIVKSNSKETANSSQSRTTEKEFVAVEHFFQRQKETGDQNYYRETKELYKEEIVPKKVRRSRINFKRVVNQCYKNISTQPADVPKTVHFVDFAGQAEYYACHQIYLNKRAFFILVLDISLGLNGVVEIQAEEDDPFLCNKEGSPFVKKTQKDFFIYWLKSIYVHCGPSARVLVVVTHAEKSSKQDKEKFQEDLWDAAKNLEKNVSVHLERKIFFISLPKSNEEQLEDIGYIRQYIAEIVQKQYYWGQLVPASWVLFEEILQDMKCEFKMLTFDEILEISKSLSEIPVDMVQVMDMLTFFNDIGTILFFQENSLKEYVIIDIQWFVDAFKNIVTDPQHAKEDLLSECITEWKEFNSTGILADSLLYFIWKHSTNESESMLMHKREILQFMVKLGMMTPVTKNKGEMCFYVPCVNKKAFRKDILDDSDMTSSILAFRFDTLPDILFFKFVAKCSQIWKISTEGKDICMYQTTAIFLDGDKYIVVAMTRRLITVQVVHVAKRDTGGFEVKEKAEETLSTLIKTFNYNLNFEVGFICAKKYGYLEDSCDHVIFENILNNEEPFICPQCSFSQRHNIDSSEFTYWKQHWTDVADEGLDWNDIMSSLERFHGDDSGDSDTWSTEVLLDGEGFLWQSDEKDIFDQEFKDKTGEGMRDLEYRRRGERNSSSPCKKKRI